ncbi:hypothetical protein [Fusobacterium necrophorum]|uniref:hypothetical protein n=1 Tax=Fusobacterium necrophorum TaxID=859 RepID=UPI00254F6F38|nr:hypothetical protein [Fusobacterium necrophorum]MDK4477062.1 hypothetical protein [Fusobacterium necrophorum]
MKANLEKVLEMVKENLPTYYDMTFGQMQEIYDKAKGSPFKIMVIAFEFGFGQGMKYQKNNKGKVKRI